jgi:uncharacterized delta-60 repeat protein
MLLCGVVSALASPGQLDPSFDGDGIRSIFFADSNGAVTGGVATDVALATDGDILVVGSMAPSPFGPWHDFAVARLRSDGSPELDFGDQGTTTTAFGDSTNDLAEAVAVQSDGKVVVVGATGFDFAMARYAADGTLDPTFSGDGRQVLSLAPDAFYETARAVEIQPDGRIVVLGVSTQPRTDSQIALLRCGANGQLDKTFGNGGVILSDIEPIGGNPSEGLVGENPRAMSIAPSGRIYVAADWFDGSVQAWHLLRYTAKGRLDQSFGTGGVATANLGGLGGSVGGVAVQPDGKVIVVGGSFIDDVDLGVVAVARFLPDGTLDPGFGVGGFVKVNIGPGSDVGTDVGLLPDGRMAVSVSYTDASFAYNLGALVFESDGQLDNGFGTGGFAIAPGTTADGVAIQGDGGIVIGGWGIDPTHAWPPTFLAVRFLSE